MTIQKRVLAFLVLSCFLFATVFSVSGCGGLASLVTTAASTSLGGMEAWVFVPGVGAKNASHTSKVTPPSGFIALPGATLTIVGTGYSAVTDSSGYASITGLANGTYTVTVAKEGYKTYSYTVTVTTGVDTQVGGSGGIETETSTAPGIMNLSATSGAIGDSVTITGVNFGSTQGTSVVQFNSVDATTITSWSSTSIVCKVPAGATTGDVVVKVGSEASNTVSFTVSGGGTPVIDHLTPEEGAEGASVTITGSNFGSSQGASTVTFYNGKTAIIAMPSDWSDTTIITTVPGQATTGDVIVTVGGVDSNKKSFGVLAWRTMDSGTGQTLNAVCARSSDGNVYAVGTDYTILRYTPAGTWTKQASGIVGQAFKGVWAPSPGVDVFAMGIPPESNVKNIMRSTSNGPWADTSSGFVDITVNAMWGSSLSNAYAVGSSADKTKNIRYFDGSSWSPVADSKALKSLSAIWGSSETNIYAVGQAGVMTRYTGAWASVESGTELSLTGVWCTSDGVNVIAVCQNDGKIVVSSNSGASWAERTAVPGVSDQFNGVWGSSINDVFIVCNSYKILHYDGKSWSSMTLPPDGTNPNLLGVSGTSSSNVFAVGADGKILHYGTE